MSFGDFLHQRIFKPLEMNGTIAYEKGKNEVANRAYGHTLNAGVWRETDQSSTSATLGDGASTRLSTIWKNGIAPSRATRCLPRKTWRQP